MPAPTTATELADLIRKSGLIDPARLKGYAASREDTPVPADALAVRLQADGLLTPFQAAQLLRGKFRRLVLGKYKVLDRIGLGGMGEVFLAEHRSMRRRAAIKVLPRNRYEDPFARERFLREARAAGQLDHPNLVRAFDVGDEGGTIYLVMEYVEGISLDALVARRGPLDPAAAANYLVQIARGLAYLGDSGLVHRDIKPANILVTPDGVVKILDLGLVRSESDIDDLTRREGSPLLGSADYLAPEQAVSSKVDIRADIYGLGATAFFLLTGRPPFHSAPTAALKMIAHQLTPPPPVSAVRPRVPADLVAAVARMLAKKPNERFQTPAEVVGALGRWADAPPVRPEAATSNRKADSARQPRAPYPGDPPSRPKPASRAPRPALTVVPPDPDAPAVLPAELSHGETVTMPALRDEDTQKRIPPRSAEPVAGRLRRRLSLAVAFALTIAIAAWDVAVSTGAVPKPGVGQIPTAFRR